MRPCLVIVVAVLPACSYSDSSTCPGEPNTGNCGSLSACVTDPSDEDYGWCGGGVYVCADGAWKLTGWCDVWPLDVRDEITLHQVIRSTTCVGLVPREPLVLIATDAGIDGPSLTGEAPVVVLDASVAAYFRSAGVTATVTDEWLTDTGDPVAPTIAYRLDLRWDGQIAGTAVAQLPACEALLDVTGTFTPQWGPSARQDPGPRTAGSKTQAPDGLEQ